jgi:hypothetical protein
LTGLEGVTGRKAVDTEALNAEKLNRTEPKTAWPWVRYIVIAAIAIWLVIWMLRLSGIDV